MEIIELIKKIKTKKILVIGDIMLDNYFVGKSNRISPEAPVPILLESNTKKVPGGASNVALNLIAARQKVSLMSVVGNDKGADELLNILKNNSVDTSLILKDKNRITTVKNRFIGQNNIQMFRFDQECTVNITDELCERFYSLLEQNINKYDLIIISDYNKGFLSEKNTSKFISIANNNNVKVLIDIKEPNYNKYKNAYLLKPNLHELANITNIDINSENDIFNACDLLMKNTSCKYVLVTRGKDGMSLFDGKKLTNIECMSHEVYDVTGAGDSVISYLAVGLLNGYSLIDSSYISSYAAGVKVSKMGTYAVKPEEIIDYIIDSMNVLDENKIVSIDKLVKILEGNTKKIVFTNGCFDIFHVGHLRYLKESSKYGDILIVGLNSDSSVKRLKGEKRPIVNQDERAELIASLSFVSYVVIFDDDTPFEIIKKIKPNIITKGGDYKPIDVVGNDIISTYGGKVIICPLQKDKSTSNIITKILESYNE